MAFLPTSRGRAPVWDSNTDEVVIHVEGPVDSVVVPPECTYMVFTISDITSGTNIVTITPDAVDINSGIVLEDAATGGGDRNFGVAVKPGTSIFLRVPSLIADEADVNVTRYYTKK